MYFIANVMSFIFSNKRILLRNHTENVPEEYTTEASVLTGVGNENLSFPPKYSEH